MGTTLTIVNDTPFEWRCKTSYDEAALKIASTLLLVVSTLAEMTAIYAAFGPKLFRLQGDVVNKYKIFGCLHTEMGNVANSVFKTSGGISIGTSLAWFGLSTFTMIANELEKEKFELVRPMGRHMWDHLYPYSWQASACVRSYMINQTTERIESLVMQPIFSGGFKNKNRDHHIAWWLARRTIRSDDITIPFLSDATMNQTQIAPLKSNQPAVTDSFVPGNGTVIQPVETAGNKYTPSNLTASEPIAPLSLQVNTQSNNTQN